VRHGHPKFIEISMAQIIAQFSCNGTYEPDTCDALLRRFQQAGPNGATTAWRHYLETDFAVIPSHEHFPYALATGRRAPSNSFFVPIHRVYMEIPSLWMLPTGKNPFLHSFFEIYDLCWQMRALAGEDYISSRSIQNQWVGKHIQYDVSKCMLVS
jgi:hypothetical protein